MPISKTIICVSGFAVSSVFGTPSSLFWFAAVATTVKRAAHTSRVRFFVVVLPDEPVIPTILPLRWRRHSRARSAMACAVSGTCMIDAPSSLAKMPACRSGASMTSTPAAPARSAASTKACPSTRSPGRATYSHPGCTSRESHVMPVSSALPSIGSIRNSPPVYRAICFAFRRMIDPLPSAGPRHRARPLRRARGTPPPRRAGYPGPSPR